MEIAAKLDNTLTDPLPAGYTLQRVLCLRRSHEVGVINLEKALRVYG